MASGLIGRDAVTMGGDFRPEAAFLPPQAGSPRDSIALTGRQWSKGFFAGLGSGLFIQIIGYLSFLEIYLLVTFPAYAGRMLRVASVSGARSFTLFWLLWVIGQVVSDVVNLNDFGYAARGFAKSFFSGFVTLALLPLMLRQRRLFEAFLAGLPLAHLIGAKYFRSGAYTRQDGRGWMTGEDLGWEAWGGHFFTLSLAYLVARFWRSRPWACVFATFGLGIVHIYLGSRSTGLYHILAASAMLLLVDATRPSVRGSAKRSSWTRRLPWGRFVAAAGLLIAVAVGVKDGYESFAASGALGEKAYNKYQMQSKYGNLIVGARQGPFIGIAAALDKPIVGHGAWARMDKDYIAAASDLFGAEFHREKNFNYHSVFIPSHSMVIAAWVEAGIFGLLFWMFAMVFVARNVPRAVLVLPEYAGVIMINSMGFFWSVLFSPIQSRNYTAMIMVPLLYVAVYSKLKQPAVRHRARSAPAPEPAAQFG